MWYFSARRYGIAEMSLKHFFGQLDHVLSDQGVHRCGALMGFGVAYQGSGSKVLGMVKVDYTTNGVKVEVSTIRKSARKFMILTVLLGFPLALPIGYLAKVGVLPATPSIIAWGVAISAIFLTLFYEYTMGIFPSTRRLGREMMRACDVVISSMGGKARSRWELAWKSVKIRKRYWGHGVDVVDASDFM